MYTPGHAVLNLAVLGGAVNTPFGAAVVAGAVLPDVPIFVLYAIERARGTAPDDIWSGPYQQRFWQNLIHAMHSIPLWLIGIAASLIFGSPVAAAFFASLLLHALFDLPLHAIDAHRQFLPFSHYRFVSPISYWDVRFHARTVAVFEVLLVLGATLILWRMKPNIPARAALLAVNSWYLINYYRYFLRSPDPR